MPDIIWDPLGRMRGRITCAVVPRCMGRRHVLGGRFTEVELMSGENRWRAGEHGLQEARKGVRFTALPPVLQVIQTNGSRLPWGLQGQSCLQLELN